MPNSAGMFNLLPNVGDGSTADNFAIVKLSSVGTTTISIEETTFLYIVRVYLLARM